MRERDDRARRTRGGQPGPGYGTPTRPGGTNAWQAVAIVALIAAAAGWTTVALLAFREPAAIAAADPTSQPTTAAFASGDPGIVDPSLDDPDVTPPDLESHEYPALESILPTEAGGVDLVAQSVDGGAILSDDIWSSTITDFLASVDKTSSDLHVAYASTLNGVLDISVEVYQIDGVDGEALMAALMAAWQADSVDVVVSDAKLGGKAVRKVDLGEGVPITYVYADGDTVFDIWTDDKSLAAEALAALQARAADPSAGPSVRDDR